MFFGIPLSLFRRSVTVKGERICLSRGQEQAFSSVSVFVGVTGWTEMGWETRDSGQTAVLA